MDDKTARVMELMRQNGSWKRSRTSTYDPKSPRALAGAAAEAEALVWLQVQLEACGVNWQVFNWQESRRREVTLGPCDDDLRMAAIDNANNGDLYVYTRDDYWSDPRLLFSVEVKGSNRHPNVTINAPEIYGSSAEYLIGVTGGGPWICTMEDARKNARKFESYNGYYYVVEQARVRKVPIQEIIDAHTKR